MIHITLIENDERVVNILTEHLKAEFEAEVFHFSQALDALHAIEEKSSDKHLIIARNQLGDEDTAGLVINKIYDQDYKPPVIIMGDYDHAYKQYECLPDRFRVEEMNRLMIRLLKLSKEDLELFKLPDYVPFPIANFYLMDNCDCDVFIRIKKKEGDQYIKRIRANDEFDKKAIKKYEEMNVGELYIQKEFRSKFMNQLLEQSVKKIKESIDSGKSHLEVGADSFEISHNLIHSMGISAHSVQMAEASVKAMADSISQEDRLVAFLQELLSQKGGFAYKRSFLISLFAYEVIPLMDWGKGEQLRLNFEKIVFVSYFHDICLVKPSLMRIMNMKELKEADITDKERELVLNHANEASSLIQSYPHAPQGADIIIRQHHGTTNGVGFPDRYSGSISSMAIVFIVLEAFATKMLDYDVVNLSLKKVIEDIEGDFTLPSFRKVVEALKTVINKAPLS